MNSSTVKRDKFRKIVQVQDNSARQNLSELKSIKSIISWGLMIHGGSTTGLYVALHEPVFNTPEGYMDIGYSLGFYFNVPSLTTLYRFIKSLKLDMMYQIMKENVKELIKTGCEDISM